jgi:hypothetical protein
LLDLCAEEMALSCLAPGLRRCVHLLESLDGIQAHAAASWGERVQGGDKIPAAVRRSELLGELEAMPPKLVKIAERLRGYPVGTARGKYIQGILSGHSGEALRKATGLSRRRMEENRRWLAGIVE